MYPDGLCRLDDTTWSRCIEFEDVNYQLAQKDDQTAIFEALCDMYNALFLYQAWNYPLCAGK